MIDTGHKLTAFLPRLRDAAWIALDTEADSLHAYPEKLCLIQIGFAGGDVLLDPLAGLELAPVFAELGRHELILHGADYDLRLLQRHCHFVPKTIFDTMLAARLLGVHQFGLDNLVAKYLGVTLEKGPQKANWARRPLTPRMETYARNDTRHLKPLADILRAELTAKGRLEWHAETCRQLVAECALPRTVDADQQWRVKGSSRLPPRALAVLRALWQWREHEAVTANRPPYFVLQPDTMIGLALAAVDHADLDTPLPRHLTRRRRTGILNAIDAGLAAQDLPKPPTHRGRRQTEAEKRRLRELERRRNQHAAALKLDPSLIASRATLAQLARDWDAHSPELMAWQRDLLRPE
ncbi:MAG: HRDC domain-containing protein [Verrucomicrobia bacterium]|nr:HRDC domain-containing protein [Verrucomicrobiota bacterium]